MRDAGGSSPTPTPVTTPAPSVTVRIDPGLTSPGIPATIEDGGEERPVGVLMGPDGVAEGFVLNQVRVRAETQEELDAFLGKYGGVVLQDGSSSLVPEELRVREVSREPWYLVEVDVSRSSMDDLASNASAAGMSGEVAFSSEDAVRLLAIVARERELRAKHNLVLNVDVSLDHPCVANDNRHCSLSNDGLRYLDAAKWDWMSEDDDPQAPGDQGLSVGVTHAWDFLEYKDVVRVDSSTGSVSFNPVRVAVIDTGFDLDPDTGVPRWSNLDYFNSLSPPLQLNFGLLGVLQRDRAGGPGSGTTSGGTKIPWHGQIMFGVCCAKSGNGFGGAGTGGPVAQPILIRVPVTLNGMANGIFAAAEMGAGVISISMGVDCGFGCELADTFNDDESGQAVSEATRVGAVVVASAGNNGHDLGDHRFLPCEFTQSICVGAVLLHNQNPNEIGTEQNFGRSVDISAPEGKLSRGIFSTITEEALERDIENGVPNDDLANVLNNREDEVARAGGTSAATAFVAGVIALLKAADPSLNTEQVRQILQSTANKPASVDNKVPKGYVDAFRALAAVLPENLPPTVQFVKPPDNMTFGWQNRPRFEVEYFDPEVDLADAYQVQRFPARVEYSSSLDGLLCSSTTPASYSCESDIAELTIGLHEIVAVASDGFGGTAMDEITLTVINRAPSAEILSPQASDALFSTIPVFFNAFTPDPDELILDENVSWASSLDGLLGTGRQLTAPLSTGTHSITLTAIDGKGLSATDQVTVMVASGEGAPLPVITMPDVNFLFAPGELVTFEGSATDPEDGVLPGTALDWSSDTDGLLGTGNSIQVMLSSEGDPCNQRRHIITLTATDSDGKAVSVTITVYIGTLC